jgi:hypothetical protein
MARSLILLGVVAVAVVVGWRFAVAHGVRERVAGGVAAVRSAEEKAVDQAKETVALSRAAQAELALETLLAEASHPAVTAAALHAVDGSLDSSVEVVRQSGRYCVQASYKGTVAHSTGPGQSATGPCPT